MGNKDLLAEKEFLKLKKNLDNTVKQQDKILEKFNEIEEFTKEQINWDIQDVDFLQNVIVNTYEKIHTIETTLICILIFTVIINGFGVILMLCASKGG